MAPKSFTNSLETTTESSPSHISWDFYATHLDFPFFISKNFCRHFSIVASCATYREVSEAFFHSWTLSHRWISLLKTARFILIFERSLMMETLLFWFWDFSAVSWDENTEIRVEKKKMGSEWVQNNSYIVDQSCSKNQACYRIL